MAGRVGHAIILIIFNRMALCVVKLDTWCRCATPSRGIPVKRNHRHGHYSLTGLRPSVVSHSPIPTYKKNCRTPSAHVRGMIISHNMSQKNIITVPVPKIVHTTPRCAPPNDATTTATSNTYLYTFRFNPIRYITMCAPPTGLTMCPLI